MAYLSGVIMSSNCRIREKKTTINKKPKLMMMLLNMVKTSLYSLSQQ